MKIPSKEFDKLKESVNKVIKDKKGRLSREEAYHEAGVFHCKGYPLQEIVARLELK